MQKQIVILLICLSFSCVSIYAEKLSLLDSLIIRHNDYGTYGMYTQSYDSSKAFFENEINTCEKNKFWDLALGGINFLATVADRFQRYDDMRKALAKGNSIIHSHKKYLDSADITYSVRAGFFNQLAVYYRRISKVKESEQILSDLIRLLNRNHNTGNETLFTTYAHIADLYFDIGLYEKAYPYYVLMGKSIPDGDYRDYYEFDHLQYLSSYFVRVRDFRAAKKLLSSALHKKYVRKVNSEWNERVTSFYELLSKTYQGLQSFDSAVFYMRKSVALQDTNSPTLIYTYEAFGDCYAGFKKYREALNYYSKVDSLYRISTSRSSFRKAEILSKIGESQLNLYNASGALRTVQSAFYTIYNDSSYLRNLAKNPLFSSIHPDRVFIRLFMVKSGAMAELARKTSSNGNYLKSSVQSYLLTSKLVDRFRHEINTDDFKQLFVTDIRPMYEKAVNACWHAWETDHEDSLINRAYYFMEKSKYQVLLDAINSGNAENSGGLPDQVYNRINDYKTRLVSQQNMITMLEIKDNGFQLEKIKMDYAQTRNRYEEFLDTLAEMYPAYYNLQFNDVIKSIDYLKKNTRKKVFVEYMVADGFIAIIAANRDKTFFKLLPADRLFYESLDKLLRILRENPYLGNKPEDILFRDFVINSNRLYTILFRDIRDHFNSSHHFVIVTDGVLSYLPFEILVEKYTEGLSNYANLNYLVTSSVIGYEFSGSILLQKPGKSAYRFIQNYIGFAPESETTGSRIVKLVSGPVSLGPLQFSGKEVKSAKSVFNGKLFSGSEADVLQFTKNASGSRIIHFAGHTLINDSLPGLSGLVFAEKGNMGSPVLFANEILNFDLKADLVLLSTCESGTGKLFKGEGLISIGRSFRYAGAKSIVMTMWKINDQSASEIIIDFCRKIKKGRTSDIALREAKLKYLKSADPKFNHPYFWAAFILIGDEGPVMKNWERWVISSVILVLLFLFFLRMTRYISGKGMN